MYGNGKVIENREISDSLIKLFKFLQNQKILFDQIRVYDDDGKGIRWVGFLYTGTWKSKNTAPTHKLGYITLCILSDYCMVFGKWAYRVVELT